MTTWDTSNDGTPIHDSRSRGGDRALAVIAVAALLVNIFARQQEARNLFYRVVELTDDTVDPDVWGKNFPLQYDGYRRTVDQVRGWVRDPTRISPRTLCGGADVDTAAGVGALGIIEFSGRQPMNSAIDIAAA